MMQTCSKSIYSLFIQLALLVSPAGGVVTYTPADAAGIRFAKPVPDSVLEAGQTEAAKSRQEGFSGRFKPNRIG